MSRFKLFRYQHPRTANSTKAPRLSSDISIEIDAKVAFMLMQVNMRVYQEISRVTSMIDNMVQEALYVKSQLSRMPMMEPGVGRIINIMA